jgi:Tfp pilus assembly protein PilN
MFISKEEKLKISNSLQYIDQQNASFHSRLNTLEKKIAELEKRPATVVKTEKKQMTALQKAKQRVYQMEYKQRMKAKKLEEQGKNNVSA